MAYKWRPSKSQRKEFANKMKDPYERAEYEARKQERADKRRAGSKFDYQSAGGFYVPTKAQSDYAYKFFLELELTQEQRDACTFVIAAYSGQEKVHHDFIHIVNELIRTQTNKL